MVFLWFFLFADPETLADLEPADPLPKICRAPPKFCRGWIEEQSEVAIPVFVAS